MDEIPKINPEEKESILIPKINPNEENSLKDAETDNGLLPKRKKFSFKTFKFGKLLKSRWAKISGIVLTVLLVIFLVLGFLFWRVYAQGRRVLTSARNVQAAFDEQDLVKVESEFQVTKTEVIRLQSIYKSVSWLKFVPYFGGFIEDGEHAINASAYASEVGEILVEAIAPYADIVGFKSNEQTDKSEVTTQDKIDFVISTLPGIIPVADKLAEKADMARNEINEIEIERYPETLLGNRVREKVANAIDLANLGADFALGAKPLLEVSPYLLGVEEERRYLIIFQNDKELRPTGGFITAYTLATVNNGRFSPVASDDIYNLDSLYTPSVPAPEPVRKYLKGPYLISQYYRLRDMNWSPDFARSIELFTEEAEKAGIEDIDGVIAVDTHLLVNILNVLGEIQVPGYGGYSNNIVEVCNCPQVVYELESFADLEGPIVWSENEPGKIVFAPPNYDNRKKIIGPMMNTILADTLSLPTSKMPALFEAIARSFFEKHVMLYMFDSNVQGALESFGIAGRVKNYEGDYLMINDANLGGRKSNLYVTQEVEQDVDISADGQVIKTLTITYNNPMRHDGWLNSVLPNWVRVYVPQGSELIDFSGVEEKEEAYEEFGKSVFAGFFQLRPQGVSKVTISYKLPFRIDGEYGLFIQKQPGKDAPLYTINLGEIRDEFFLRTDKEIRQRL